MCSRQWGKPAFCLLLLIGFTSCNGQAQNAPPNSRISAQSSHATSHPILRKTQGSGKYDNIHCSLMDRAGNLWFGTTGEGLYRYDGKSFTQFTKGEGLGSNTVWSLLEDTAGVLWIGTDAGLCRYTPQAAGSRAITRIPVTTIAGNHFLAFPKSTQTSSLQNAVWSLLQDKTGRLWVGADDGLYCYDGIAFTRFPGDGHIANDSGLTLKGIQCMLQDRSGNIWFGSGPMAFEGLSWYDGKTLTKMGPDRENWIRYLKEDKTGLIWIGTRHRGIWRYGGKAFTKFRDGADVGLVSTDLDIGLSGLFDKAGNFWFSGGEAANGYGGAGNGIWRYDGKALANSGTKDGLGDYSAWTMVEDRAGNIWVGTRNTGLYRYDGRTFTCFSE